MEYLLEVEGLKKSFGGVAALADGRLQLSAGSVHALCGGNGAGKSTLLSILMGIYRRDAGKIWRNGHEVDFSSPAEALASGIAIIEQELSPIPQMTVAENVFLGREPAGRFGGVDFRKMNVAAQTILDDLGFAISARHMYNRRRQAQLVEIAKALSHEAEVIFMDEPTSAIGHREAHQLFAVVQAGCALKGAASCTSRTGCRRSSTSPIATPCSATAPTSARACSLTSIAPASSA